jgi:hypothetical protein
MFENRVLRKTFRPKLEINRRIQKMYNEELHNLFSSPNIFTVIKSRRIR